MTQTKFVYSSYWGTWSRILAEGVQGYQTAEVNLTPLNSDWNKVRLVWIRLHCTTRRPKDLIVDRLPAEWWDVLGNHLGPELRHRLCTEDFMAQIDWGKYRDLCNGGAPLHMISRTEPCVHVPKKAALDSSVWCLRCAAYLGEAN